MKDSIAESPPVAESCTTTSSLVVAVGFINSRETGSVGVVGGLSGPVTGSVWCTVDSGGAALRDVAGGCSSGVGISTNSGSWKHPALYD